MPRVRCGFAPHWRTTTNCVQKLRKKIWKLLKQYAVITVTGPDNETLYSGPVWGNLDTDTNTMRNDLPLGRYS